ncbi:MAG: energy transducer TonB [Terriglobia bacterium]|nr:energy transducer TonB [Terriglobia bacterium]
MAVRISRIALGVTLAFISTSLVSQQQSGETKLGSETPASEVYRVGGSVSPPQVIKAPDPQYSKEALKKKIEGTVVLWVVIGPDGVPKDVRVQRSLGYGLDQEAIEAVKKWKFKPAKLKGQPVTVQVNVEVNFRLYQRY